MRVFLQNKEEITWSIAFQYVVDGPIGAMHLLKTHGGIQLVVGSLGGFCCVWKNVLEENDSKPIPVVMNLWSGRLCQEDSVLTVDACGNMIVLGTFTGHVLLYQEEEGDNYSLVWKSLLPYSVHKVSLRIQDQPNLVVMTSSVSSNTRSTESCGDDETVASFV
eukprot:CAMPEP_0118678586 /NCGR_PEP_ID=MMETSP0800-20121206/3305_1 /TAXON_ID=210618 ORGANISM="Striatella unipunctata, Strain CCMP2910" /NCGR_SAMPLE_ID=MMETSP0800 /ASSEMBLY_ACC=CAM_ASM_000638 /LENGTH=162 /DNA_ID=CAMNT_0006574467 /DNA_START=87 /DNA_END=575 /DNA_ORIENTATION=+